MSQAEPYSEGQELHRGRRYTVFRMRGADGVVRILKVARAGGQAASSAAMLRHEYELLAGLEGIDGIVRPIGLTELNGALALALEDAGPQNLMQMLRRRPLRIEAFFPRAIQLATILGSLHDRKIIHRDVNATNVVAGDAGLHLTLIDFGLASSIEGAQRRVSQGDVEGTLRAIAPEQTGRVNRSVDHRADLYSLGATFYEMLTGRPPFSSSDPAELVHAHLARAPAPPIDANPAVPRLLNDLVLKLLEKMPEQRYQSAEALVADLRSIDKSSPAASPVAAFELGRIDRERELAFPRRLYGREPEIDELHRAFDRAAEGSSELVLVTGAGGIGKSALVRELFTSNAVRGSRQLSVKFDELRKNVPYAPIIDAVRDFVRGLSREPPATVDAWRSRLRPALGPIASVVLDVIPDLAELLGTTSSIDAARPPSSAVPSYVAEAERRFPLALGSLVQAFATSESPFLVFLDDLHSADAASMRLLPFLAVPEASHLLVVAAYRTDGTEPDPSLERALDAVAKTGVIARTIPLAPLDLDGLTSLSADALRCTRERARPLAAILLQKTAGNPFFVERFLRHLQRTGLLAFDRERGSWDWDARQVAEVDVTENVVDLMVAAIRGLPDDTQRLLRTAACLPGRIELDVLAAIDGADVDDTAKKLWSALCEGLLVPDVATSAGLHHEPANESIITASPVYRFVHDRVQQAAYSMLSGEEQKRVHLAAGWKLLERMREGGAEERLLDAVDQLDRGATLLTDPERRHHVAELNLRAARKAKASSAFGQALTYATNGIDLLPPDAWRSHHALWLALSREAAECAYLTGDFGRARALLESSSERAATRFERLELDWLSILSSTVALDHHAAIRCARDALRRFGVALPDGAAAAATARADTAALEQALRDRTSADLLDAPAMHDPEALACMRLLSNLTAPTWMITDQDLFSFVVRTMVELSLRHGMAPESGGGFVRFGMILGEANGNFAAGYELSHLGVELAKRYGDKRQECRALFGFAFHMSHWQTPLHSTVALYRRAATMGLESGELEYAVFAREHTSANLWAMGTELDRVLADVDKAMAFASKLDHQMSVEALRLRRQAIRCLQGRTRGTSFDDDAFDTKQFIETARRMKPELLCRLDVLSLEVRYILGDIVGARAMADAAGAQIDALRGTVVLPEYNVFASLTLAAIARDAPPKERDELLAIVDDNQSFLERWAEACPENYRHGHRLVAAELVRARGQPLDTALDLYEQAIDGARKERSLRDEALGLELAGRCLHEHGRKITASHYLRAAVNTFYRWGATAKAEALEGEFRGLVAASTGTASSVTPCGAEASVASLDVMSLLKAAETLSSEVVFDRLLEKLLALCLEAAGARRGALVLEENGGLVVRAIGTVFEPVALERTPLGASTQLPRSIVEEVFREGEPMVLANAVRQGRFTSDPYVSGCGVKSALAVPFRRQAKTMGVIYLENDLATRAFTSERVRVLELLSSGMAIALDNSLLFEKLNIEIRERARAEQGVRFLAEASALLAESLDYEATLAKAARLAVPFLADWCLVDVIGADGTLNRVAAAHAEPSKAPLLRELKDSHPAPNPMLPPVMASRTGQPYLCASVTDELTEVVGPGGHRAELVRALGCRSLMAVPLVARDRTVGAITFFSGAPGRPYGPTDLALAEELGRRAAFSIDNARLYQQAQEAIRLRNDFVALASHELNTPLASLALAVQSVMRSKVPLSSETMHALSMVERQGARLSTLVSEMLDISRLGSGRFEMQIEKVDLAGVLRDAIERLGQQLALAKCAVTVSADRAVVGRWDRTRLAQVVTNLLTNAMKFGKGKPLEVVLEERDGMARLTVEDHGIGIEPTRLSRVFERFERGVSAEHYGGLGLGLYIVREIVNALGGTVRVESEVGIGSKFFVDLPCAGPLRFGSRRRTAPGTPG